MNVMPPSSLAPIESWEVLDLLASLVQKSLVVYEEDEQGQGRYRLLETVRQYARDGLEEGGEAEAVRGRHADYFLQFFVAADRPLEESIVLARAAGQKWDAAHSLFHWALLAIDQRECARATARAQECVSLASEAGDSWLHALSLVPLGLAALHQGDAVAARAFLEESRAGALTMEDTVFIARVTMRLGVVALSLGECEPAGSLYREALMHSREVADQRTIAGCLCGLAAAAAPAQPERAARLFGAAEFLRETIGSPYLSQVFDPVGYDDHVAALRAQLDEETVAAAWAEGRAMSLEQAIALALEESDEATD